MTVTFIKEWDENTEIGWWNEGRRRLNIVVRAFNAWQRDSLVMGGYNEPVALEILALVEEGRQTWAAVDGGEGWLEVLAQVEELVHRAGYKLP